MGFPQLPPASSPASCLRLLTRGGGGLTTGRQMSGGMQEEGKERKMRGSDRRTTADLCGPPEPPEWATSAGTGEGRWQLHGETLAAVRERGGVARCCPLPALTVASVPRRGGLRADPPSEAAVPPPPARHSSRRPNLRPKRFGCSPHDGEGENPPGEVPAAPFQPQHGPG